MLMNSRGTYDSMTFRTLVKGAIIALLLALTPTGAMAQDGPYFELVSPPVPDDAKNYGGTWTVGDGTATLDLYGNGKYRSSHGWSLPAAFDARGFDLRLMVSGAVTCGPMSIGTAVSSSNLAFADDVRGIEATALSEGQFPNCPQKTTSNRGVLHVVPAAGTYAVGDTLALHVGASYGPGVLYTFTVTKPGSTDGKGAVTTITGDDTTTDTTGDEGSGGLEASLDCPDSIVIGELPGLQCALEISGYVRNTSKPVVVSSPSEVDGYGNTTSGVQLSVLTGSADPSNWDSSYHWPFSPFACAPGSPHVGANCHDHAASPGDAMIPIIVSQEGVGQVTVQWAVRILPGAVRLSGYNGKWMTKYGEMHIEVSGNDIVGDYPYNGGRIYGKIDGAVLDGFWVQTEGAGRACDTKFAGAKAWGHFVFTLGADGKSFAGLWGYCNEKIDRAGWDGVRP